MAPKTDPPLKTWPEFRLKNHNREKIMYNMNAPNEGRQMFSLKELEYAPKAKIDQQQLPAYFLETDLAAKVIDYDAVLYFGIASRIMDMDYTAMNKGLADPVNRIDVSMNDGFDFVHLKLVNITDSNKPVEHDLSSSNFNNGETVITRDEISRLIEELNHKGKPRKRTRSKLVTQKNFNRLDYVRAEDGSLIRRNLTPTEKAEMIKVRMTELNAPVIQAQMIKITKMMGKKRVKLIFLSAGRQTVTRLSKDCFNWTANIDKDILDEPNSEWYKFFEGCWRLPDMIDPKHPVTIVNPEPSNDGTAFEHGIKPDSDHWSEYQKNKFQAHIGNQEVNTFLGQLTVVERSNTNPMKCYVIPLYGNYVFWSALSATENPCTVSKPVPVIDTKYKIIGEVPTGGRVNLKAIPKQKERLKAMVQLVKHNRGEIDTFTMGENYANTKDPRKDEPDTPILCTKMTLPLIPVDEEYKCSTLVANAENFARASQLFYEIKVDFDARAEEGWIQMERDENLRQEKLVGVGIGSAGLMMGLYGSGNFKGGQMMEQRNDFICEAFDSQVDTKIREHIPEFTLTAPQGKKISIKCYALE